MIPRLARLSNIVANSKKMWLSERGIDTKAASAQVLVYYLMVGISS
jgi:hypothetical protein